ncbi:MAG: DUF2852 domain-containing protein [Pseudomonadota bacterium]
MTTITHAPTRSGPNWFRRAEMWLDDRGKGAWIASMILGFVFFWPIGLFLLAYMIWSKRMFNTSCSKRRTHNPAFGFKSSGNTAFDSYKADMLKRLEDEQHAFESFLERLREAKDKQEFDSFMEERAEAATSQPSEKPAQ